MSKERGQIAYEAIHAFGVGKWKWSQLGKSKRNRWASVESAVRRAALEEAVKCAEEVAVLADLESRPFKAMGADAVVDAIRRLMEQDNG